MCPEGNKREWRTSKYTEYTDQVHRQESFHHVYFILRVTTFLIVLTYVKTCGYWIQRIDELPHLSYHLSFLLP